MDLLRLLVTTLNRNREIVPPTPPEPPPWEKDNSWLINATIVPEFTVKQVYYTDMHGPENLTTGVTDISFVVTKV